LENETKIAPNAIEALQAVGKRPVVVAEPVNDPKGVSGRNTREFFDGENGAPQKCL
jgi:hypothetical protein